MLPVTYSRYRRTAFSQRCVADHLVNGSHFSFTLVLFLVECWQIESNVSIYSELCFSYWLSVQIRATKTTTTNKSLRWTVDSLGDSLCCWNRFHIQGIVIHNLNAKIFTTKQFNFKAQNVSVQNICWIWRIWTSETKRQLTLDRTVSCWWCIYTVLCILDQITHTAAPLHSHNQFCFALPFYWFSRSCSESCDCC